MNRAQRYALTVLFTVCVFFGTYQISNASNVIPTGSNLFISNPRSLPNGLDSQNAILISSTGQLILTPTNGQREILTASNSGTAGVFSPGTETLYDTGNGGLKYHFFTYANGVTELRSIENPQGASDAESGQFSSTYPYTGTPGAPLSALQSNDPHYVIVPVDNPNTPGGKDYYINSEKLPSDCSRGVGTLGVATVGIDCTTEQGNKYTFDQSGTFQKLNGSFSNTAYALGINIVALPSTVTRAGTAAIQAYLANRHLGTVAALAAAANAGAAQVNPGNRIANGLTGTVDAAQTDVNKCQEAPGSPIFTAACAVRVLAIFSNYLMRGISWLLWLSGVLFDKLITYTVVNLSQQIKSFTGIGTIWTLFRDIANIGFIFIMIAISIGTILQSSAYNVKQLLVKVIIAAVVMNFSLFYTKALIDFSNVFALAFYNRITVSNPVQTGRQTADIPLDKGISQGFLNTLGVNGLYSPKAGSVAQNVDGGLGTTANQVVGGTNGNTPASQQPGNNTPATPGTVPWNLQAGAYWNITIISIFGSILLIIAAIAFFSAALMLLYRFISLLLLLASSVLPVVAIILPATQSFANEWWSRLQKELLALPVFMVLIYIAFIFMQNIQKANVLTLGDGLAGIGTGDTSITNVLVSYAFTVALIFGAVLGAQAVGGAGAKTTGAVFTNLTNRFRGAVGRNTVGRLSKGAGSIYGNVAARVVPGAIKGLDAFSNSKFGKSKLAALGTLGLTKAIPGGLKAAIVNADLGTRNVLKMGEDGKYGGYQTNKEVDKEERERLTELKGTASIQKLKENHKKYDGRRKEIEGIISNAEQAAKENIKLEDWQVKELEEAVKVKDAYMKSLKELNPKQLAELDMKTLEGVQEDLTTSQHEGLFKEEKLKDSDELQKKLRTARFASFNALVNTMGSNSEEIAKEFEAISKGDKKISPELAALIKKRFTEDNVNQYDFDPANPLSQVIMRNLSKGVSEKAAKASNFTEPTKAAFKAERKKRFGENIIKNYSQKQISDMMDEYEGGDLADIIIDETKKGNNLTENDGFIRGIKRSQLEKIGEKLSVRTDGPPGPPPFPGTTPEAMKARAEYDNVVMKAEYENGVRDNARVNIKNKISAMESHPAYLQMQNNNIKTFITDRERDDDSIKAANKSRGDAVNYAADAHNVSTNDMAAIATLATRKEADEAHRKAVEAVDRAHEGAVAAAKLAAEHAAKVKDNGVKKAEAEKHAKEADDFAKLAKLHADSVKDLTKITPLIRAVEANEVRNKADTAAKQAKASQEQADRDAVQADIAAALRKLSGGGKP